MLAAFLDAARNRPWAWGSWDCCCFAGEWVRTATGRDPFAPYRGRYASAAEARRLILRAGDLAGLLDPEMVRCGFARADAPRDGDIAVVTMGDAGEHAAAGASVMIADGPWWIGLTLDGIAGVRAEPAQVWRVLDGGL